MTGNGLSTLKRVVQTSKRWRKHRDGFRALESELGPKAVRIRYESLCRDPGEVLGGVGRALDLDCEDLAERLQRGQCLRQVPHLLRGNANLRKQKEIRLCYDQAYTREMKWLDRTLVSVFARSI